VNLPRRSNQRLAVLLTFALLASAIAAFVGRPAPLGATSQRTWAHWQLTPAGHARVPDLSFILSAPAVPHGLVLTENGRPVKYSVSPLGKSAGDLGVVLALDTSLSMRRSLTTALEAARQFVARRQQHQLTAILTFNGAGSHLSPLTDSGTALASELAVTPKLDNGTPLYDAVGLAANTLAAADVNSGAIILLSDGSDTGSSLNAKSALALARLHHYRIFTVGLRSPSYDATTLKSLAAASGGLYSEASSPRQLSAIYGQLANELSSQYLLTYRSHVHVGGLVEVQASDGHTTAASRYIIPLSAAPLSSGGAPAGILLTVMTFLLPALLVFAAAFGLLSRDRQPKPEDDSLQSTLAREKREKRVSRFSSTRWWKNLQHDIELAQIKLPSRQKIVMALGVWVALIIVAATVSPLLEIAIMIAPLGSRFILKHKLSSRRKRFAQQFPDTLQVLASALRAGHTISSAMRVALEDCLEPTKTEYRRVLSDERLGMSLDESLRRAAERMENEDLLEVAMAAQLQQQTGGNTAEVFDRVIETIRGREDIYRRVAALTAQGRMARWIVTALPVGLAAIISLLNPGYIHPLFVDLPGQIILGTSIVMLLIGSVAIKKIVEIEV
jgi:tight adherence protein B